MHGSPAASAALVTGSIVVALYCAASLAVRGRSLSRGPLAEANHIVMALAMVAMLLPATMDLVPPLIGLAAFAALALAWLVVPLARRSGSPRGGACAPAHLVLVNAAMAIMYAAMVPVTTSAPLAPAAPMAAMTGMTGMAAMPGMPAASAIAVLCLAGGVALVVHAAGSVGATVAGSLSRSAAPSGADRPVTGGVLARVAESPRAHLSCQALMSGVMAVALLLSL